MESMKTVTYLTTYLAVITAICCFYKVFSKSSETRVANAD